MSVNLNASLPPLVRWLWQEAESPPETVEQKARALLLDSLACMIAGTAKPEVHRYARELGALETGPVTWPGLGNGASPVSLAPSAAAMVIGAATCWDEACEGLARAHGRPGLHAFTAALPIVAAQNASLQRLLTALIIGFEVAGRLGETFRIYPGMHVDGTWGTFGAVASVGYLLQRSATDILDALNAAACQIPNSLYRPVAQGRTVRNLYPGLAASRAIALVTGSAAGIDAPDDALTDLERVFRSPDTWTPHGTWLIEEGYLKPYAAVRHVHYGAFAAAEHHGAHPDTRDITSLELEIYEEATVYCGNRAPKTPIAAQFSLTYGLAHALVHGDLGPDAYTAERLADPEVRRLESLIAVTVASFPENRRAAVLRVHTADATLSYSAENVPGDVDNPLDETALRAKCLAYLRPVIGERRAQRLIDDVLGGPADASVNQLLSSP